MSMLKNIQRLCKGFKSTFRDTKVNLLIAGAQKSGTSALDSYLREHPQICMAERKEVHFFDSSTFLRWKRLAYPFYHSHFNPMPEHQIIGESTPIYMWWEDSIKFIWEYNPKMKIILVLRNPIERAFSHWNMERDRNAEIKTFGEAIRMERERCRQALPRQHRVFSYVDRGFYAEQLRRIWRYFPESQTLVLKNDHLRSSLDDTLEKITSFLEVDRFSNIKAKDVHSRPYVCPMVLEDKKYLANLFEFEIRELERMLGWDCKNWLDIKD